MAPPKYVNDTSLTLAKSGRGDWIRTSDPLRPRQVRYQAALRPDSNFPRILAHICAGTNPTVPKLSQNDGCRKTRTSAVSEFGAVRLKKSLGF